MWRASDYHFDLPAAQIAQVPTDRRDASRLALLGRDGALDHRRFVDLPALLPPSAVVVLNDARVVPARLRGRKPSGGAVELLLLSPGAAPGQWHALARSSKALRDGGEILLEDRAGRVAATARVVGSRAKDGTVEVAVPGDVPALLDAIGEVPLPPYIERPAGPTAGDRERYQTVYARAPGAVAAPTAGLHFTAELLAAVEAAGHTIAHLTLEVGLGTFAPVRDDDLRRHVMHVERYDIPQETADLVASGRPVVAIGTTVARALEAAAVAPRQVAAGPGATALFIGPGHRFRAIDRLVTNFHLPGSTLLVLVAAFAGRQRILAGYREAVRAGYRFYSYGDAMLLEPGT